MTITNATRIGRMLALAAAVCGAGCDDGNSNTPADLATPDLATPDLAIGKTVTGTAFVSDGVSSAPVNGAKACLIDPVVTPQPCCTTGADGKCSVGGIPANTPILVKVTADAQNYYPTVTGAVTKDVDFTGSTALVKSAIVQVFAGAVGEQIDDAKAQIAFAIVNGNYVPPSQDGGAMGDGGGMPAARGVAGATATLTPASGKGPFYADASGIPLKNAMATSDSGILLFMNVDPGTAQVDATIPGNQTCTLSYGWPGTGTAGKSVKTKATAGALNALSIVCK